MAIHSTHFSPYFSVGLMTAQSDARSVVSLRKQIQSEVLSSRPKSERNQSKIPVKLIDKFHESSVTGTGFVYQVREVPAWWQGPGPGTPVNQEIKTPLLNDVHHVVIIFKLKKTLAVYTSNSSDWGKIQRGIANNKISGVELVSPEIINGAFTNADWPMGTVWMKGLHNSVESKADSKQLTGLNIRSVIDPFGDQTYHFSSGRSMVPESADNEIQLGLSPRKHRIWIGRSESFQNFCEQAAWAMRLLADANAISAPISGLAQPLSSIAGLGIPEEVGWSPVGESSSWSEDLKAAFHLLEPAKLEISTQGSVVVDGDDGKTVEASLNVMEGGSAASTVGLEIRYFNSVNAVELSFTEQKDSDDSSNWLEALRTIFIIEKWGIFRYEDGTVVSGDVAYYPAYSTKPFLSWDWVDFQLGGQVNVTKEKPIAKGETDKRKTDLRRIGQSSDDSLFTWIHRKWGCGRDGLLLCDDGSGEVADFLHLAPKNVDGYSALTLIHAKASSSSDLNRGLSVSEYEIVVAQAIKNLAHASTESIINKITKLSSKSMVWEQGKLKKEKDASLEFAEALKSRNHRTRLQVIIIQPHTTRSKYEINPELVSESLKNRHAQLSALLWEAEAACRNVGATFTVVASEDEIDEAVGP